MNLYEFILKTFEEHVQCIYNCLFFSMDKNTEAFQSIKKKNSSILVLPGFSQELVSYTNLPFLDVYIKNVC